MNIIEQLPYLSWILIFILFPSLVLWAFFRNYLRQFFRLFLFFTIFAFIWGLFLDILGSSIWRIWFYENNLGIYFLRLPLEEYLTLLFLPQELVIMLLLIRKKIYG